MQDSEIEDYQYNRIVIIGNGFDIAWGLPTSYNDFILDYLKDSFKDSIKNQRPKESFLITINPNSVYNFSKIEEYLNGFKKISELLEDCKHKFTYNIKSELLQLILEKQYNLNWVDIESLYFNLLLTKIEEVKKFSLINRNYSKIELLNNEFEELSSALKSYISKVNSKFIPSYNGNNLYLLNDKMIEKDDSSNNLIIHKKKQIPNPSKILFLNFNYTNSLEKVTKNLRAKFSIVNIHGEVGSQDNPIIFGYGDDSHPKYQEVEDEDHNQSLKHIKSFYYFKSNNYLKLDNFMADTNKYEVLIVGHSCGLSDRTLLKTVFENENCISIKIFHFEGLDDYFQKSIAVSRHFSNKPNLRKKIIPFDKQANIPQFKFQ
ncbi:AbiH family protein [Aquirufa salirivi]|uniref:AbiH family protein n=1 Tax=Aquirufa salirivi TaxID=3104729 RepID=A0ABW8RS96_9BACT